MNKTRNSLINLNSNTKKYNYNERERESEIERDKLNYVFFLFQIEERYEKLILNK